MVESYTGTIDNVSSKITNIQLSSTSSSDSSGSSTSQSSTIALRQLDRPLSSPVKKNQQIKAEKLTLISSVLYFNNLRRPIIQKLFKRNLSYKLK